MVSQVLMDEALFERVVDRLAHQLLEHHDFNHSDLIGLQPRGYWFAQVLQSRLHELLPDVNINCGGLDVTFHRDDFSPEGKTAESLFNSHGLLSRKPERDFG